MIDAAEERAFRAAFRESVRATERDDLAFRMAGSSDLLSRRTYLAACEPLYVEALRMLATRGVRGWPERVLDAGGTDGVFATALRFLGVTVVAGTDAEEPVGLVIGLALHAEAEPAARIARHGECLAPGGKLVLAVPSNQYWPVVLGGLRRRLPAEPPQTETIELGTPATSRSDLEDVLRRSKLRPELIRGRDYTPAAIGGPSRQIIAAVLTRARARFREVWIGLATREDDP